MAPYERCPLRKMNSEKKKGESQLEKLENNIQSHMETPKNLAL